MLSSSLYGDPEAAVLRPLQAHLPGTEGGAIAEKTTAKIVIIQLNGSQLEKDMNGIGHGGGGGVTPPSPFSRFLIVANKIYQSIFRPIVYF